MASTHMQVGSAAWAAKEPAPCALSAGDVRFSDQPAAGAAHAATQSQTSESDRGMRNAQPASMPSPPNPASNGAASRIPSASASAELDLQAAHGRWHNPSAAQASSPMPARIRSTSDLQHGSSSKEESAQDLRDAQQQAAEANKELQRLREDRDQLRVALASALSQTQQLGALQSEVSMLKGQLEETRQMTMHSMTRTASAVSLPYDQVTLLHSLAHPVLQTFTIQPEHCAESQPVHLNSKAKWWPDF